MLAKLHKSVVLAVLLVILGGVVAYQWLAAPRVTTSATRPAASRPGAARPGNVDGPPEPLELRLSALAAPRPEPPEGGRNLFRVRPTVVLPPAVVRPTPGAVPGLPGGAPGAPPESAGPPPPPPITLKLIGVVERTQAGQRIAVLSDGKDVFYGRDGEIVDGRFRVLKVGAESVEVSYVDGRGRRVIPLSGS